MVLNDFKTSFSKFDNIFEKGFSNISLLEPLYLFLRTKFYNLTINNNLFSVFSIVCQHALKKHLKHAANVCSKITPFRTNSEKKKKKKNQMLLSVEFKNPLVMHIYG